MAQSVGQRLIDGWNRRDGDIFAEDGTNENIAVGAKWEGREAISRYLNEVEFSTDYRLVLLGEQSSGDQYALEWESMGTNDGPLAGMPPTNRPYRLRGSSIGRLDADGKITENRDYYNVLDLMTQLGLLPGPKS